MKGTTLKIEPELTAQAAALFKELGMDLSTATGIFYRQALRYRGRRLMCVWMNRMKPRMPQWMPQKMIKCMARLIPCLI